MICAQFNICVIIFTICIVIARTSDDPDEMAVNVTGNDNYILGLDRAQLVQNKSSESAQFFKSRSMCHCSDTGVCSPTGDCSDGCGDGWMGPQCQYLNLADKRAVNVSGEDYILELERAHWVSWVQIQSSESGISIDNLRFEVFVNNSGWTTCESTISKKMNSDYNIFCETPILSKKIKLLGWTSSQPKILISGGMDVALKQVTTQSTIYYNYTSDLPVSGKIGTTLLGGSCAHTFESNVFTAPATWTLILNQEYVARSFLILNRKDFYYRLVGFTLSIASESEREFEVIYTGHRKRQSVYRPVPSPMPLVKKARVTAKEISNIVTICTFKLFADCKDKWFTYECNKQCNCKTEDEVCEKVFGLCKSGCADGFAGMGCSEGCADGTYGPDCQSTCNCLNGLTCNTATGFCENGCSIGYSGDDCNAKCDSLKFGQECKSTCHCLNIDECNHINGSCGTGCADGYSGDACQTSLNPTSTPKPKEEGMSGTLIAVIAFMLIGIIIGVFLKLKSMRSSKGKPGEDEEVDDEEEEGGEDEEEEEEEDDE